MLGKEKYFSENWVGIKEKKTQKKLGDTRKNYQVKSIF